MTYIYYCKQCEARRQVVRPIAKRNNPLGCQQCGSLMVRDAGAEGRTHSYVTRRAVDEPENKYADSYPLDEHNRNLVGQGASEKQKVENMKHWDRVHEKQRESLTPFEPKPEPSLAETVFSGAPI